MALSEGATPRRPRPPDATPLRRFTRGTAFPRGVKWFGVRSFWGHLRHFLAAAIATEDVDSRDWMTPDAPLELLEHVSRELGGKSGATSLLEALERDVWIDFIADTGDDSAVSRATAQLLFAPYELPDPDRPGETLLAPRGDILLFGGDTAYPVATAQEITNRVVVPFNQVLDALPRDDRRRVLLAIPGNHDWYDGLDGFARLFRRRAPGDIEARPSLVGVSQVMLEHYADWAREFVRGGKIEKPHTLVLDGYTPVQNASYFVLPISDRIQLLAVDRQLRTPDSRQRLFLMGHYQDHPELATWMLLPDPLYRFGVASQSGTAMLESLRIDLGAHDHFLLSGDVHHYQRLEEERLLHVIAGGGGAFLHPARMVDGGLPSQKSWPDARQSRSLLGQAPWKIAAGRSGILPHLVLLALYVPGMAFGMSLYKKLGFILSAPVATTLVLGTIFALIGGVRRRKSVLPLAFTAAAITALLPVFSSLLLVHVFRELGVTATAALVALLTLGVSIFLGTYVFGAYLTLLTRFGFEHTQAFTALDHPGFKHFLRLRVRGDGLGIDGYCIGLADPLGRPDDPLLVDTFQWRPKTRP
ncbi:MAG TPA: hypothetical protein VGK73_27945 [Polyangiaceae bacterium]